MIGKYVKNISSVLLSHDFDEASIFLAKWVDSKEKFTQFLDLAFPGDHLKSVRQRIEEKYPPKIFDNDQKQRMRQVLRDSTFVCNKYQLYKAYKKESDVYAIRYEMPPATHGSDLLAIIYNSSFDLSAVLKSFFKNAPDFLFEFLEAVFNPMAIQYQRYLAGFGISGDPNYFTTARMPQWAKAHDDGDEITNSLKIGIYINNLFSTGVDKQTSASACDFWNEIASDISKATTLSEAIESSLSVQGLEL